MRPSKNPRTSRVAAVKRSSGSPPKRPSSPGSAQREYKSRTLREKFKRKSFAEEWQEAVGSEEPVMDLSDEMMLSEDDAGAGATPPGGEEIPIDTNDLIETTEEATESPSVKPTVIEDLATPLQVFDSETESDAGDRSAESGEVIPELDGDQVEDLVEEEESQADAVTGEILDLVEDDQHLVCSAEPDRLRQEAIRLNDHARRALNEWLQN